MDRPFKLAFNKIAPINPTWKQISGDSYTVEKPGVLLLEFAKARGERQYDWNNKQFFALYKFQDPIFERSAPKVTKPRDSDINISETDFSISEEDKRALKEAEALLNEPTISFDN